MLTASVFELAKVVENNPALLAHVRGPLTRKAERADKASNNRSGRLLKARVVKAILRVQRAAEKPVEAPVVDLKGTWTLETARVAFRLLGESGKSRAAFARENGFSASRFGRWADRV